MRTGLLGLVAVVGTLFFGTLSAQAQEVIFFDDFESGGFTQSEWQIIPGELGGLIEVVSDDITPRNGLYGVRVGKSIDGEATTNVLDLRLDLSGRQEVDLNFWIYNHFDDTNIQDGIFFSDDGGTTFTKVYDFDPSFWAREVYGQLPPLEVDRLARENGLALTEQFVIRFQQHGSGDFSTNADEDGFFLDDVSVTVPPFPYAALPFEDSFESGTLGSAWRRGDASRSTPPGIVVPEGRVEVGSGDITATGFFDVAIGRRVDGNATTNALDLHLNLAGHDQVELSFAIFNFFDETNIHDGLWFSDNGGETFTKVYDFDLSRWSTLIYGQLPPIDVDRLARDNGLRLTEQFIIRFQQHGSGDFSTNADEDGFFLDDVSVRVPEVIYVAPPFEDSFEAGVLGNVWSRGDASLSTPPGIVSPDGIITVVSDDVTPRTGLFGVRMGRHSDGNETTNALDLHLNLSHHRQIELRFWILDFFDEPNVEDGIWFSNNGGETFTKVVSFDTLVNDIYQERVLDVDTLAADADLAFTDRFVIRFQQHGSGDFSTSSDEDGFFLDDISVTGNCISSPRCNDREATIIGTENADTLMGTPGDDVIVALGGDDVIFGLDGNDIICGGDGNDFLVGGSGNDSLFGESGADRLVGEEDNDLLSGGVGNDNLFGGAGTNTLRGDTGDDRLFSENASDVRDGGDGATEVFSNFATLGDVTQDGLLTPADALCVFRMVLQLPSCLDE